MSKTRTMGRREFLRLAAMATGAVALSGCEAPPASTPAPTKGPAASTPAAVGQPTKSAAATAGPTPSGSSGSKLGATLIGKFEGPEIVTDPTKSPKKFAEAPMLADLVKAGKLPAVSERVSQDPIVVKPLHEIGKYGGTWRRGFTGPADNWNGLRAGGRDSLMFWDYTGAKLTPSIAKSWEFADEGRTITVFLRRGMKWSDGQPFTADDLLFWFEDINSNSDLLAAPTALLTINGKPGKVEKVDDYTVRYVFPDPYPTLPEVMAGPTDINGQAFRGGIGCGIFSPAHYLKQFHAKYRPKAELDQEVKKAGFDHWAKLFLARSEWSVNPDLPVVTPWRTVNPINTPQWVLERNPYSVWVDTEGNQLPYIDKIVMSLAENLEVINLRAIAGEYDHQSRHIDLSKLPVLLENQERGGYTVRLDPAEHGADAILWFNLSYEADPEMAKWIGNVDFRRALSQGIQRDQLNETFWLGTGRPGSPVPDESNVFFPGKEYVTLWHTYDPKPANDLLDKIGLSKKDADGYRLRTDGKGRLRIELLCQSGQFMPYAQILEMIAQQWKQIGIQGDVAEVERGLYYSRVDANEHQIACRVNDGAVKLWTTAGHLLPYSPTSNERGPLFGQWYASNGTKGKEPPPRIKEALEMYRKGYGVPEEERLKLGKEIWKISVEDVWAIGTVGCSPASGGVRIINNKLGNIPSRVVNASYAFTPGTALPQTFYWKS